MKAKISAFLGELQDFDPERNPNHFVQHLYSGIMDLNSGKMLESVLDSDLDADCKELFERLEQIPGEFNKPFRQMLVDYVVDCLGYVAKNRDLLVRLRKDLSNSKPVEIFDAESGELRTFGQAEAYKMISKVLMEGTEKWSQG